LVTREISKESGDPTAAQLRLWGSAVSEAVSDPRSEAPCGRRISPRLRLRTPEKRVEPDPSAEGVGPTALAWIGSVLATHAGLWPVQRVFPEYRTACSERSRAETLRPPGAGEFPSSGIGRSCTTNGVRRE